MSLLQQLQRIGDMHCWKWLYVAIPAVLLTSIPGVALSQSAPLGQSDPQVHKLFVAERKAHVGESLPPGIEVINRKGEKIDLRSVLHGPAILFRVQPNCPPCEDILVMLRKPGMLKLTKGATIVVLRTDDDGKSSMHLPATAIALHTPAKLQGNGFLDGYVTPTTFYFDNASKLLKREVGKPLAPQTLLQFPSAP